MARVVQAVIAAVGLVALALHLVTFSSLDAELAWLMFPVHAGAMASMFAAVGLLVFISVDAKPEGETKRSASLVTVLSALPWPAIVLVVGCFAYALLNWVAFLGNMGGGGPTQLDDGSYVLSNHGTVVRTLTEAEYFQHRRWELRGFSGHWLLATVLPVVLIEYRDRIRERLVGPTA